MPSKSFVVSKYLACRLAHVYSLIFSTTQDAQGRKLIDAKPTEI